MSQFDPLAVYQPAVSTDTESSNPQETTPRKQLKDPERASKHRDFRKEERALELEAFRLVGVADEPSGTGPNGETRKWRQCKAVINEIERLRDQLLTMTIHNEILQSQVNNLEFEKTDLQQQVTRTVTLAVEQEGAMANLEAKSSRLEAENSLLKTQVEAYTWPTAATDFSEMDFGETAFGGTYQSMVDGMGDGQQ